MNVTARTNVGRGGGEPAIYVDPRIWYTSLGHALHLATITGGHNKYSPMLFLKIRKYLPGRFCVCIVGPIFYAPHK